MEIAVHEALDGAYLEVLDGEKIRLHITMGMSGTDLAEKFGESLSEQQLRVVVDLLSSDATKRVFETKNGCVFIRPQ